MPIQEKGGRGLLMGYEMSRYSIEFDATSAAYHPQKYENAEAEPPKP